MRAMGDLPSGILTFLFTDIEGSTRLWQSDADAKAAALARHDDIMRAAVSLSRPTPSMPSRSGTPDPVPAEPVQREKRDQRMITRTAEPCLDEEPAEFVAVQSQVRDLMGVLPVYPVRNPAIAPRSVAFKGSSRRTSSTVVDC